MIAADELQSRTPMRGHEFGVFLKLRAMAKMHRFACLWLMVLSISQWYLRLHTTLLLIIKRRVQNTVTSSAMLPRKALLAAVAGLLLSAAVPANAVSVMHELKATKDTVHFGIIPRSSSMSPLTPDPLTHMLTFTRQVISPKL